MRMLFGLSVLALSAWGCGEPCNDPSASTDVRGSFAVTVDSMSGACDSITLPSTVRYEALVGVQVDGCASGSSGFSATCRLDASKSCDDGGAFTLDVLFDDELDRADGMMVRSDASGAACVADVILDRI